MTLPGQEVIILTSSSRYMEVIISAVKNVHNVEMEHSLFLEMHTKPTAKCSLYIYCYDILYLQE